MTIIDANVLLYAYNADAPQQAAARRWLNQLMDSQETVALPWISIWAFMRIATNSRVWRAPLSPNQAFSVVEEWLELPRVFVVHPGPRHLELLKRLVVNYNAAGSKLTDAVLAALALENGASLASTDQDFSRFKLIRWINPLQATN